MIYIYIYIVSYNLYNVIYMYMIAHLKQIICTMPFKYVYVYGCVLTSYYYIRCVSSVFPDASANT